MRRVIVNSLQRIGCDECVPAGDGAEALARFDDSIGFVITDWNMPCMSGLELVAALRRDPRAAKLPVLMVTTRTVREDVVAGARAGVNNYIVKPFTPPVLKDGIDAVLAAVGAAA